MPLVLLELKCETVYLAMSHLSRFQEHAVNTLISPDATTYSDFGCHFIVLFNLCYRSLNSGPCNSLNCSGHFYEFDDDNDDEDDDLVHT